MAITAEKLVLRYNPRFSRVETKEQMLDVFADLKKEYLILSSSFSIRTGDSKPIKNFEEFLRAAVRGDIVSLVGSEIINIENMGLVVGDKNSIVYNLSSVRDLAEHWDGTIKKTPLFCTNCRNYRVIKSALEPEGEVYGCEFGEDSSNCGNYDGPVIKQPETPGAGQLEALIIEASQ